MRWVAGVMLALSMSCSSGPNDVPPTVHGADEPRFDNASQLLAAARAQGLACADEHEFNPVENINSDAEKPPADGVQCQLASGDPLYVVVYASGDQRRHAFQYGHIQFDLCAYTSSVQTQALDHWNSLVAANWRASTPGPTEALDGLDQALGGSPEPEVVSCLFRM